MGGIAARIADYIWGGCLLLMRKPIMQRMQAHLRHNPKVWESHLRQNRFALLHGRRMLRFLVKAFLLYFAFIITYATMVEVIGRGWLNLPDSVRSRVEKE